MPPRLRPTRIEYVVDGVRQNNALVYLTEDVRSRPNLTIAGDALVDRVLFDQEKAVGVVQADGREITANEVILCAGSYASPAILLRSGIAGCFHDAPTAKPSSINSRSSSGRFSGRTTNQSGGKAPSNSGWKRGLSRTISYACG